MEKSSKTKETCICPRCRGNGYIKVPHKSVEELNKSVTMNCPQCESEGEIYGPFDTENDTIIIDADGVHKLQ